MTESPKICLLTGFPNGFFAQKLLAQLLIKYPELQVQCLVGEAQLERSQQLLTRLPIAEQARVELVCGDVTAMDFGMAGRRFLELARRVDLIHHCTCANYGGVFGEAERRHYVGSTGEVLELASASEQHLSRLVHWSSALLFQPQNGRVTETDSSRPLGFRSRVDDMRYRAELLVRGMMTRVPTTILRPTIIVGDSKTGEMDKSEGPYALLQLITNSPREVPLPVPGRGDQPCPFVPIDYVIEAGLALADNAHSAGRTFHISDERPSSVGHVFDLIADAADRPPVGPSLTRNLAALLLHAPGLERISQVPRGFLELLASEVVYDARNSRELLAGTGIECPSVSTYLKTMVTRVRRDQEVSGRPSRARRPTAHDEQHDPLDP
jgi:nucleoside-diphosphate-sugar epimerase